MSRSMIVSGFLAFAALLGATLGTAGTARMEPEKPYLSLAELRAKYADPAGRIMIIDGVEVYYKDEGHGPALLMVHGSESSLKTWDGVAAKLKGKYRIIRYDIPPQGLSGPVSDEALAKLQPTDIAEKLLARLGVKRITFVGVSSGGTLGSFLAAKRPDLVDRLIISNAPSGPVDTSHMKFPESWAQAQKQAKETGFKDQAFWNEFLSYFSGDPTRISAKTRQEYYDFSRRAPEKNIIGLVARAGADPDKTIAAMGAVTAPTLLIWGGKDALLPPQSADALAQNLSKAQVSKIFMPDVGHYPPLESPERFAQIVSAFIEAAAPLTQERR